MNTDLITTCRRNSAKFVGYGRRLLSYAERRLYVPPQTARVHRWWAADPQEQQRYAYDLTSDSLVFDLGGYRGQWASDIFARYTCAVEVFEPVPEYAAEIERRFAANPQIAVHQFGLAGETGTSRIALSADRSSLYRADSDAREVRLVEARSFLAQRGFPTIDLMKINIEGGEYELLEHLLDHDLTRRIRNIQVQFHEDVLTDATQRMQRLQARLAQSHEPTYQFPFVWENWCVKPSRGTSSAADPTSTTDNVCTRTAA